ncbi:MAG: trypsin-like serine protease [Bryobacterales bacterium]|nr:trypsin-like serine protease [Bryobacterales bacterium]
MFSRFLSLLLAAAPAWAIAIGDPNAAALGFNSFAAGVAYMGGCGGVLLGTGMHVLTAAHCMNPGPSNLIFANATGVPLYDIASVSIHPDYEPLNTVNPAAADLAVLTLATTVDPSIPRYQLYTGSGELGSTYIIAGYGLPGNGATGVSGNLGTLRSAQNVFEDDAANQLAGFMPGSFLLFDFDNGNAAQNGLGGLGLGAAEGVGAPGDSGSPLFLFLSGVYYIAGIQSFSANVQDSNGTTLFDIDNAVNGTYGEWGGATRVSNYQNWINSITGVNTAVPEPGTFVLAGLGFAGLLWQRRRATRN